MIAKFPRQKKRDLQSIFFSVLLGGLFFIIAGFLIVANFRINQKRAELNARIDSLKTEIQALEEKNKQLRGQVAQVSQESYLEKEARERFNLKKPGEEVVAILPAEEKTETLEAEKEIWWNPFTW